MSLPTGTVTFLFTDIEGSTRLWEEHPEAMRQALVRHDSLLRRVIEQHSGYVFKTMGDAFHAVFAFAPDALMAALETQRALLAERWEGIGSLTVRMALHTGGVQERDGDYFGPPLNRVSRLLAAGHGRQILMSQATYELVRDALPPGTTIRDLGSHRLRDLARPESIFQLLHPDLPADFLPLKSLDNLPNNLPRQLTSFIGRESEMQEVKSLLQAACLLTLTGTGGCGKTRLSLQVAADVLDEYPDGVWLVELAPLADPSLLPQSIAAALKVQEEPGRSLQETLMDYLKARLLLLVLDNCEHLIEACAHLAESLLKACPKVKVLATSREALGIAGETTWRIPSLTLPDSRNPVSIESLTQYEAVQLFIDRAIAALPAFAVSNRNAPALAQICYRLDGIPLAIELAAARVKGLSVEQIAQRLDDRFRLLSGGSRTALPRQQTLRALIDWSYDLLSEAEQVFLGRLSVFAGGWSLEAAEAICSGEGIEDWQVLDLLLKLVDKSLVVVKDQGEMRYHLLETIRQYGRDRLMESGEMESVRRRHRNWFVELVEKAEWELWTERAPVWLERLETEHDNLRAALEWSQADEGGIEVGWRLAGVLWRFWYLRGYWSEGREWLEAVLAKGGDAAISSARAKALYGAGVLAWDQDDYTRAIPLLEKSLDIQRELGDKKEAAYPLMVLGAIAEFQGSYERAQQLLEESLALSREIRNMDGIIWSLSYLGRASFDQGRDEAAISFCEESLALAREAGHTWGKADSLLTLGAVTGFQGDYMQARRLLLESLALFRELGNKRGIAMALFLIGFIECRQQNRASSRAQLEESLTIFQNLGDKEGTGFALEGFAGLAIAQQHPERATRLLGAAEALRKEIGTPLPPVWSADYNTNIAAARAALGEEGFKTAWAQGRSMPLEQAIAHALEEKIDA